MCLPLCNKWVYLQIFIENPYVNYNTRISLHQCFISNYQYILSICTYGCQMHKTPNYMFPVLRVLEEGDGGTCAPPSPGGLYKKCPRNTFLYPRTMFKLMFIISLSPFHSPIFCKFNASHPRNTLINYSIEVYHVH